MRFIQIALLMFAAVAVADHAGAQANGNTQSNQVCHGMGSLASSAAEWRNRGLPVAKAIEAASMAQADTNAKEGSRRLLELVIGDVYKTKDTPNAAYEKWRSICQRDIRP